MFQLIDEGRLEKDCLNCCSMDDDTVKTLRFTTKEHTSNGMSVALCANCRKQLAQFLSSEFKFDENGSNSTKILYNRYRNPSYVKRNPKSSLARHVFNRITDDLYKMMDAPNFDIYLDDKRSISTDEAVCDIWYADQIAGTITLVRELGPKKRYRWIIHSINIRRKEWFDFSRLEVNKDKKYAFMNWCSKYINAELHEPIKRI